MSTDIHFMGVDCYRVLICNTAICDKKSNLCTFVSVHESWSLPAEVFGQNVPLQAHFAIRGRGAFEIRMVWVDGDVRSYPAGDVDAVSIDGYDRFMSPQVKVPEKPGIYDLMLEWRTAADAKWRRCAARAPIVVELLKAKGEAS